MQSVLGEVYGTHRARGPEISCGCRWLIKRIPYMTHISCDSSTEEAAEVLCGLLPRLSDSIAPTTELSVKLDRSMLLKVLFLY